MIPLEDCVIRGESDSALSVRMRTPGMTIMDGRGGSLALDLSHPELCWLADACEQLTGGNVSGILKVHAAGQVYVLARHSHADQQVEISISSLFDPGERVVLTEDTVHLATLMIRLALAASDPSA